MLKEASLFASLDSPPKIASTYSILRPLFLSFIVTAPEMLMNLSVLKTNMFDGTRVVASHPFFSGLYPLEVKLAKRIVLSVMIARSVAPSWDRT